MGPGFINIDQTGSRFCWVLVLWVPGPGTGPGYGFCLKNIPQISVRFFLINNHYHDSFSSPFSPNLGKEMEVNWVKIKICHSISGHNNPISHGGEKMSQT